MFKFKKMPGEIKFISKYSTDDIDVTNIKIFISHKMTGMSESKINEIRWDAIKKVKSIICKIYDIPNNQKNYQLVIIDNYHHPEAPENAGRLWHLGRSIQQMGDADYIYFADKSAFSSGCAIEHVIARIYGCKILNDLIE